MNLLSSAFNSADIDKLHIPDPEQEDASLKSSLNVSERAINEEEARVNLGDIGGAIAFIREAMGLNQSQLADLLKIGKPALSMIENNKRIPGLTNLSAIAIALGDVPITTILLKAKSLAEPENISLQEKVDALVSMCVTLSKVELSESESTRQSKQVTSLHFEALSIN